MTMKIIWPLILIATLLFPSSLQAQICNDSISKTSPTSRFIINGNGTVTDKETELTWMRCSLGQLWDGITCTGNANRRNWKDALYLAENYNFADSGDWRLPNAKELISITEKSCYNPSINELIFPSTKQENYSSSTSSIYIHCDECYWVVRFTDGFNAGISKNSPGYIRLVRGGQ